MALGIALAVALLAGAPDVSPAAPAEQPRPVETSAAAPCVTPLPDADTREIVVCAERPQGYRLNRDVMEAHREKHGAGRPRAREALKDDSCQTVGPMKCVGTGAGINVLGAAATLGKMADRLSKGQEIGSMFETTPDPTEYELYVAAKKRREAEEADAALEAKIPPKP